MTHCTMSGHSTAELHHCEIKLIILLTITLMINLIILITPILRNTKLIRKEGNVLLNDALNTFYLRLYGIRHMVEDHSDSERGNPVPLYGLLFPISSKGSFICIKAAKGRQ